jgi:hypothetical protein
MLTIILSVIFFLMLLYTVRNKLVLSNIVRSFFYSGLLCILMNTIIKEHLINKGHIIKKYDNVDIPISMVDDDHYAIFDIYNTDEQSVIIKKERGDKLDHYVMDTIPFNDVYIRESFTGTKKLINKKYRYKKLKYRSLCIVNENKLRDDGYVLNLPIYNILVE